MELLVGLGIVSIMVGASTFALVAVLRSSNITEQSQSAGLIGNSLLESVSTLAEANWNSIYNLGKTSANHYFLVRSLTTTPTPVLGDEGILEQDIIYGLAGYWKLDEDSGTSAYDSSGNGNLGTLTNGPTRTASTSCKVGACLGFDGTDDYVSGGNLGSFYTAGTIGFWMNPSVVENYRNPLATKYAGGNAGIRFEENSAGEFRAIVGNDAGTYASHNYIASGLTAETWYYIVLTWDTATNRVVGYLNGVQKFDDAHSYWATTMPSLTIGGGFSTGRFWMGFIDDVRIYNRALSAAEVLQLYKSPAYSRYFYVDNVKRTVCGTGDVTANEESACLGVSGVSEDPATQKITVGTAWNLKGANEISENSVYVTRWTNSISEQSDWGGNDGVSGAVSEFGDDYFEYSNISTTTSGSIKVSGI